MKKIKTFSVRKIVFEPWYFCIIIMQVHRNMRLNLSYVIFISFSTWPVTHQPMGAWVWDILSLWVLHSQLDHRDSFSGVGVYISDIQYFPMHAYLMQSWFDYMSNCQGCYCHRDLYAHLGDHPCTWLLWVQSLFWHDLM